MREKVRALHILPSVNGYGAERIIVELLKHLSTPAIDAALLTIYEPPADTALPFRVITAGRKGRRDRLFIWRMVREIRRYKPDIVHTHTHVGKYWGRVAALLAGVTNIVHTEHNPCDFRRTPFERAADWLLHRATARVVTFFREQGTALMDFESLPAHKLVIIPNGLTLSGAATDRAAARRKLGIEPNHFAIMTIGRMEYQKNHILALRAFAELPEQTRRRTLLFFVGSGEQEVVLLGVAHALDIARPRPVSGLSNRRTGNRSGCGSRANDLVVRRYADRLARGDDRRRPGLEHALDGRAGHAGRRPLRHDRPEF